MQLNKLTDGLSVTAQIAAADVAALKAGGFRSILCNRPDGEALFGQPAFADIEAAAKAEGLSARYLPIRMGQMSEADVAAFAAALRELPKPVLAYCRSGNRSSALFAQAKAKGLVSG